MGAQERQGTDEKTLCSLRTGGGGGGGRSGTGDREGRQNEVFFFSPLPPLLVPMLLLRRRHSSFLDLFPLRFIRSLSVLPLTPFLRAAAVPCAAAAPVLAAAFPLSALARLLSAPSRFRLRAHGAPCRLRCAIGGRRCGRKPLRYGQLGKSQKADGERPAAEGRTGRHRRGGRGAQRGRVERTQRGAARVIGEEAGPASPASRPPCSPPPRPSSPLLSLS